MDEDPISRTINGFLKIFRKTGRGGAKGPPAATRVADKPSPPPVEAPPLRVTSHVSRDLLQNAAYFNALPKAVAEYVTNAIDSALPGTRIRCEVEVAPGEVVVTDDGSGMTYAELSNFFQMHGENVQRKRGRSVRGKFGTGKSAAFGIATALQVETVKDGKRSVVELQRRDVESARDGQPIPVRLGAVDQPVPDRPSGTIIRIRGLLVEDPDPVAVQVYLEKLLGRHLRTHRVRVNGHPCRYRPPKAGLTFEFKPPEAVAAVIGRARCTLSVSPDELGRDDNTIAVLCHGFLHAATLAGRSRAPLVEYLFGEVEVPALDDDPGPVPPFDNTRSLALNSQNPRVQALEAWLGECIDEVLAKLVEREKRRQKAREARLLRRVAGSIKTFLDQDFLAIQESLPWASLPAARKPGPQPGADAGQDGRTPAGRPSGKHPSLVKRGLRWLRRLLRGRSRREAAPARPPRGLPVEFAIRYVRDGAKAARAAYDPVEGLITLNRDHPQLRTAEREAGIESSTYKMLCYDIAFTEYALAVADNLARQAAAYHQELDTSELVQKILDRLGRRAADSLERKGMDLEE
jgi:hypothetical protein